MTELRVPLKSTDHILGETTASVTLLEYGDYECPHCAHAHLIVQEIMSEFGDQLRYVFRHFPLAQIHPFAEPAAEAAEFAAEGGRFWEMHNGIFESQDVIGVPLFTELVGELELSEEDLKQALVARRFAPVVREQFMGGARSGVNGTPTFFINGRRHEGSFEYEILTEAIGEELAKAKAPRRRAG